MQAMDMGANHGPGDALPQANPVPSGATGNDLNSQIRENNNSGQGLAGQRPRRRAAAAANFATDIEASDDESMDDDNEMDPQETGSSGRPGRGKRRRAGSAAAGAGDTGKTERKPQHMQGRFSGRLPTKDDERKLADECQLMAPLLSDDGGLCTLPVIIRAMATGTVRAYLEKQRQDYTTATMKLAAIEATSGQGVIGLSEQIVAHQNEAAHLRTQVAVLEQQLFEAGLRPDPQQQAQAQQQFQQQMQMQQQQQQIQQQQQQPTGQPIQRVASISAGAVAAALGQGMPLPVQTVTMAVPMQTNGGSAQAPQVVIGAAPQVMQVPSAAGIQQAQMMPMTTEVPATLAVAQQMLPGGGCGTQPVVVTAVQPVQPAAVPAGQGLLRSIPSSAHLIDPTNGQTTEVLVMQQPAVAVAQQPQQGDDPAKAAGAAASNLNEHAHQLAVTAKLHEAAKTEASVQAQQLAAQAQQHAQASVQAAQQAEELKKTLAVLPDSQQAQQAAATVQNLEARAQAHASITTQVVAQARGMHEKAKAHESEQLKAITQASVLQAHAQSLQASAHQLEAHHVVTQAVASAPEPQTQMAAPAQTLPSLQPSTAGGVPAASGGGGGGNELMPVSAPEPGRLPTTPLSTTSGSGNLFTMAATSAAVPTSAPPPAQAAVAMVQPTMVQAGHVQLMIQQQQQQTQTTTAGTTTLVTQPTLMHAQASGDQSAEVAALHQQIAVLQAQQHQAQAQAHVQAQVQAQAHAHAHAQVQAAQVQVQAAQAQAHAQVQAAAAVVAAAQQGRPPVQVQVIPQPVGLTHVASQGMLNLVQVGSSSVNLEGSLQPPPPQAQPAALEPSPPQLNEMHHHQQQHMQHLQVSAAMLPPAVTTSAELDVPHGLEHLLPTSQPLVIDPYAMPTSGLDDRPVVSIPDLHAQPAAPVVSGSL